MGMMGLVTSLLDLRVVFTEVLGYRLSCLEFLGTATGLACVWLTAREKVWSWPLGIANAAFFFVMFFQLRLYSDMLLQVYYFATSVYGWWCWTHPRTSEESNRRRQLKISTMGRPALLLLLTTVAVSAVAFGSFISNVHDLLPGLFPEPAAYPYADSAVAVLSVAAQFIMARKKLECWLLWMAVDALATGIYFLKGVNLLALEYLVFGCIAFYGFWGWRREHRSYKLMEAAA
jgi:nicotinamide mononucleotide transporter